MNEHQEMAQDAGEASPEAVREAEARIRRLSRRSFLWAGLATGAGVGGLVAFNKYAPESNGAKIPLRKVLGFNETVAQRLFYRPTHRAREFPRSAAEEPRNNYKGTTPVVDLAAWRLRLSGLGDGAEDRKLTLADLRDLPRAEQTTELKCIEGWSTVVNWSGVRFVDFAKKYAPPSGTEYVSMLSEPADYPDERYYVGLHLADCLHPQTLLATHMNGTPLRVEHGAPLRLVIPHKYGIKNIKLITSIAYARERPTDYWYEQGYDWYAGL
ncbi:MAG: molybdopterin-dependent oxidoreductase [Cytophagales bacterium]|nr:molybdopterin-dependent oxidoreductase [Armatimonadota bacterium]